MSKFSQYPKGVAVKVVYHVLNGAVYAHVYYNNTREVMLLLDLEGSSSRLLKVVK